MFFLVAIIVGMIDPIVAGLGIGTGILWKNHRGWSMAVWTFGVVALAILHLAASTAFHREPSIIRIIAPAFSLSLWALVTAGIRQAFSQKAPPAAL